MKLTSRLTELFNLSSPRYVAYVDVETSGTDPLRNCVVSLACVVKDYKTGEVHEFYEECRPDCLTPNYEHPSMRGFIVNTWSEDAERVHGLSWKYITSKQTPFDLGVKFIKFIDQFYQETKEYIPFVYHANAQFDWRFVKGHMHKTHDKLYYAFLKRFNFNCTLDTMSIARTYIKANKEQLDIIKKNTEKINKPRKRKASEKNLDSWNSQIIDAKDSLKDRIIFEGYSLDKLCKSLGVKLNHHNALSDAKALIPILEYLIEHIEIKEEALV